MAEPHVISALVAKRAELGIVTLTGLVLDGDPDVASLDDQHFLQAPPLPA